MRATLFVPDCALNYSFKKKTVYLFVIVLSITYNLKFTKEI